MTLLSITANNFKRTLAPQILTNAWRWISFLVELFEIGQDSAKYFILNINLGLLYHFLLMGKYISWDLAISISQWGGKTKRQIYMSLAEIYNFGQNDSWVCHNILIICKFVSNKCIRNILLLTVQSRSLILNILPLVLRFSYRYIFFCGSTLYDPTCMSIQPKRYNKRCKFIKIWLILCSIIS